MTGGTVTRGRTAPVLVLAPHATRTGSTRVLIDLLARVVADDAVPLRVELLSGGPHAEALQGIAPPRRRGERVGAVLANSSLAAEALAAFADDVPVGVYVHEPGEVLATLPEEGRRQLRRAALVLCVSEPVRSDVVALGVAAERTRVLPPLVVASDPPGGAAVAAARAELGAGPSDAVVLGCGEAAWRKGTDVFVEVAARLAVRPDLRFGWVGRRLRPFSRLLDLDVAAAGLGDRFTWVGDVDVVAPYLAAADVLVAPSRFDPQPLVPLEAASAGTPTVAFTSGGLADLGRAGAALTAPYPDAPALAGHVGDLLDDPDRGAAVAGAARRWTAERQGPEVVVPEFVRALRDLLGCSVP